MSSSPHLRRVSSTTLSSNALSTLLPDISTTESVDEPYSATDSTSLTDRRIERFHEWLDGETHVNLQKIRREARHGCPAEVRADVWKYLLGVLRSEKSDELSVQHSLKAEYNERVAHVHEDDEIARRVRGEVKRMLRRDRRLSTRSDPEALALRVDEHVGVRIISAYLGAAGGRISYQPVMIQLLATFMQVVDDECETFYCFYALMQRHETIVHPEGLNRAVANFLMLLRVLEPELTEHLENEEVEPNMWVPGWLQSLLSGQLKRPNVLRLWDSYFSSSEGFELHTYVCFAVINWLKEDLLELDGPEISSYLLNLPTLDMDQIITRAYNIREDVLGRNLL